MKELFNIQQELKAPKDKRNSFGNYNYRSCEQILAAVKPLLEKERCTLTLSDTISAVANSIFVTAKATIYNEAGETIEVTASAMHDMTKKGMDSAQITGAASSYARKYALNGLFAIDDTKDPDTDEYHKTTQKAQEQYEKAIVDIMGKIKRCVSMDELLNLYNSNEQYRQDQNIMRAFSERKAQIERGL